MLQALAMTVVILSHRHEGLSLYYATISVSAQCVTRANKIAVNQKMYIGKEFWWLLNGLKTLFRKISESVGFVLRNLLFIIYLTTLYK
jgi:hypothetical protein